MSTGSIELRLRPLKLAFALNPHDKDSLRSAIEINSFLWGGAYNPIIPRFTKIPRSWKHRFHKTWTARDILAGYISAYDPDFIVTFNDADAKALTGYNRQVISHTEIFGDFKEDYSLRYGIGLMDVMQHFVHHEMRFQRRKPIKMVFPMIQGHTLFSASVFGSIPASVKEAFDSAFVDVCGIKYESTTLQNFTEFLALYTAS